MWGVCAHSVSTMKCTWAVFMYPGVRLGQEGRPQYHALPEAWGDLSASESVTVSAGMDLGVLVCVYMFQTTYPTFYFSLVHLTERDTVGSAVTMKMWLICTHAFACHWFFCMLTVCVGKLMYESRCRVVALAHFSMAGCRRATTAQEHSFANMFRVDFCVRMNVLVYCFS